MGKGGDSHGSWVPGPAVGWLSWRQAFLVVYVLRGHHRQHFLWSAVCTAGLRDWEEVFWAPGSPRLFSFSAEHPSSCAWPFQQAPPAMLNSGGNCQRKCRSSLSPTDCTRVRSRRARLLHETADKRGFPTSPSAGPQCTQWAKATTLRDIFKFTVMFRSCAVA